MNDIKQMESLIAATRELRERFDADPYRPRCHFLPPEGWMNDINGSVFWKGRYHIFYQHNPEGGYWKRMCWGHASSADLVHWVHHPIALTPDPDGPDREGGCFSGGAFIDKNNVPTLIYHGVPGGTCLATSDDDLLIHWKKHPGNPVIPVPREGEKGYGRYVVFDPCAWRDGDTYYALIGNTVPGIAGNSTSLFKSSNLADWEFVGPFYRPRPEWTEPEEDCAVPDFFPLGDRHMLLFNSHLHGTQYYLGRLNGNRFEPEIHGRMSWPGGQLGGERTLLDGQNRRIFFDWVRELRGVERERESGWSGIMTLPRILSLDSDGSPTIAPVPELESLRMNPRRHSNLRLDADTEMELGDIQGNTLELLLEIAPGDATEFGIHLFRSPNGEEQTSIVLNPAAGVLKIDVSRSTLDRNIKYYHYRNDQTVKKPVIEVNAQEAPFALNAGETLRLHLFLDRSVLEVFANGRQCITQRIYPTRRDSVGTALFTRGGKIAVPLLQAWDMAPAF